MKGTEKCPPVSFEFVCGYCEMIFCSSDLRDHHQSKSDPKVCQLSQKNPFVSEKVYPCEKCGKQFPSRDVMVTHLETHTDNVNGRSLPVNLHATIAVRYSNSTRTMYVTRGWHIMMMKPHFMFVKSVTRNSVPTDSYRGT